MPAVTVTCPFCELPASRVLAENAWAMAVRDTLPVSPGHTLVLPRRDVASWFDTSAEERAAILELIDLTKSELDDGLGPAGYNIGINVGDAGRAPQKRRTTRKRSSTRLGRDMCRLASS
jgi:diadenosine tetraphosphate (Ap4A) HIT family hydrolase